MYEKPGMFETWREAALWFGRFLFFVALVGAAVFC